MATKLFLRSTQNNGIGATYFDMAATAGSSTATAVVNSAASGTEIQWTQTAGGAAIQFVSGRAPSGGFTLTTTDISIWAHESNAQANCGGRYRVFKRTAAGVETEIGGGPFNDGVEFGTAAAEMLWAGNVTDTAFAENDRILLKLYITNVGTMGSGRTCTLTYNGANAATGDSFFNIAETVSFKSDDVTGTMAATESGSDIFAASGMVSDPSVSGAMSATEAGADALAGSGGLVVTGVASATESGVDTASASGAVSVQGTAAAGEAGSDSASSAGLVSISGTVSGVEGGADSASAAGTLSVAASLAAAEAGADGFSATGSVQAEGIIGVLAAAESGSDSLAASGAVESTGVLEAAEAGSDGFEADGTVEASSVFGSLSTVEAGADAVAAFAAILVDGMLSAAEIGSDIMGREVVTPPARRTSIGRTSRRASVGKRAA